MAQQEPGHSSKKLTPGQRAHREMEHQLREIKPSANTWNMVGRFTTWSYTAFGVVLCTCLAVGYGLKWYRQRKVHSYLEIDGFFFSFIWRTLSLSLSSLLMRLTWSKRLSGEKPSRVSQGKCNV
jgi:hypothetical protein